MVGGGTGFGRDLGLGPLPMLGLAAFRPALALPNLVGPLTDARFLIRIHAASLVGWPDGVKR
ncbi:MAG TPA: hypothetical protein VF502_18165 [Stellaceae bacterium]